MGWLPYPIEVLHTHWYTQQVVQSTAAGTHSAAESHRAALAAGILLTASVRRWTWSLPKIFRLCPFTVLQGEEQPLAHLLIRESLSHEVEDF